MRKLIALLFSAVAIVAAAQPLAFITLTGAGSLSDTAIRRAAPAIEKHTGRQVIVINMPGANGLVGVRHFMSRADSENLLLVGNSAIGYLAASKQVEQAPVPLVGLVQTDLLVYTHAGNSDLQSLLKKPDLVAATTSPMTDMSIRMFDEANQVKTLGVGYTQFGQSVLDLAARRIDYLIAPAGVSSVEAMQAAGKVHPVASLGKQFAWNAVFTKNPDAHGYLAQQIAAAVRDTTFAAAQPFPVFVDTLDKLQNLEAAAIKKHLKLAP